MVCYQAQVQIHRRATCQEATLFVLTTALPTRKKEMILLIISLSAAVVGAYGPMLSPGFVEIAANLHITVEVLSQATAWLILTIGLGLFLTNPLAKIIGRRPVFIVAVCIMFATSVWGAAVSDYHSFLASRVVAGVGMAPYEVLVQCTIGDLYYVHERATRIAVWNLFLLTGISGGALVAGYIIQYDGYQWTFGVCAIFFGVLMLAIVFLVPETIYRRDDFSAVIAAAAAAEDLKDPEKVRHLELVGEHHPHHHHHHRHHFEAAHEGHEGHDDQEAPSAATTTAGSGAVRKKQTYWQSLRVYTGVYTDAAIWKVFLRPFVLLFYPAVFWAFLLYGTTLTWIVVFSVVNGVIFVAPPYNFTVSQTGLISLSPFVLTLVGEVISGPLNDWICLYLTKKNKGIYEPEFRLPLMVVATVLGVVGFYGFGATVQYQTHWSGPVLCFGLANMSMAFIATCAFGYVVDCHRSLNEEAFVAINTRNILTFGLTYFVNTWLARDGALVVFCILGSLFVFVCLLTIPLWIFGKRLRALIARTQWLEDFMSDEK
ncbi:hypothetical protein VTK73DRAFT_1881 [Phialemonium thermophilum]|uniref:Major facilitator superfamily (MFS) profile domain-containing protein n=1 Tax=Phialemonium thermophilum TaxID=223376 RepID=A0ABR3VSV5_9PEZI